MEHKWSKKKSTAMSPLNNLPCSMTATAFSLRRLSLKNYRSIGSCDLGLGPLAIFVGQNGAGKSNIRPVRGRSGLPQSVSPSHQGSCWSVMMMPAGRRREDARRPPF